MPKVSELLRRKDPMNLAAQPLREKAADLLDECERVLSLALITARRAEQDGYVQDCIAQFDAALAKLRSNEH